MALGNAMSRRGFLAGAGAVMGGVATSALTSAACADEAAAGEQTLRAIPTIPAGEPYENGAVVDCDLLVIGTGFAGLWAALTAVEEGVTNICLVDKGSIGHSSVASLTLGTTDFILEGDDYEATLAELVLDADYLSRQDIWQDMLLTSKDRYDKITSWGHAYNGPRLTSDGNSYLKLSTGATYTDVTGTVRVAGKAGLCAVLDQVAACEGIRYFEKTMVTELLKQDDRVVGALGFNRVSGNTVAFRAKATIVATGQCTFRGQHAMVEGWTGDGYQMVYDAGGVLNNMEFLTFDCDPVGYILEGGSLLGSMGCAIENCDGENFMWNYDPQWGPGGNVGTITRGMALEVDAGRGPLRLNRDTENFGQAGEDNKWLPLLPPNSWQRINELRFAEIGIDLVKEPQEFTVNSKGINGAIEIGVDCTTAVPGLFAASCGISTDPGMMKGIPTQRAYWSGQVSARSAAAYLASAEAPTVTDDELSARAVAQLEPMGKKGSITPDELTTRLQRQLFDYRVGVVKSEQSLQTALEVCRACQEQVGELIADDPHELVKYYETRNMVSLAEMFLLASIERKESRVCHYRADYPERDDANWLKWIEFKKGVDGKPEMFYKEIPFAEYPVQPTSDSRLNVVKVAE